MIVEYTIVVLVTVMGQLVGFGELPRTYADRGKCEAAAERFVEDPQIESINKSTVIQFECRERLRSA